MSKTTIQIDVSLKSTIDELCFKYSKATPNSFIRFLIDYINRNEVNLDLEIKDSLYKEISKFDKKVESNNKEYLKRNEGLIKIVRKQEKDYFSKIPVTLEYVEKIYTYLSELENIKPKDDVIFDEDLEEKYKKNINEFRESNRNLIQENISLEEKYKGLNLHISAILDSIDVRGSRIFLKDYTIEEIEKIKEYVSRHSFS